MLRESLAQRFYPFLTQILLGKQVVQEQSQQQKCDVI